jgi:hypothetical protein
MLLLLLLLLLLLTMLLLLLLLTMLLLLLLLTMLLLVDAIAFDVARCCVCNDKQLLMLIGDMDIDVKLSNAAVEADKDTDVDRQSGKGPCWIAPNNENNDVLEMDGCEKAVATSMPVEVDVDEIAVELDMKLDSSDISDCARRSIKLGMPLYWIV